MIEVRKAALCLTGPGGLDATRRRTNMSRSIVAMATLFIVSLGSASATAQDWQPPTDAERCPSRWGADDERGAANLMSPESVLRAAQLITTGEVIEMAYPLFDGMPFYGDRVYNQQLKRTNWPAGSNNRGSNEEIITTELGQVGTQIDGFGHQSIGNSLYNCFKWGGSYDRRGPRRSLVGNRSRDIVITDFSRTPHRLTEVKDDP